MALAYSLVGLDRAQRLCGPRTLMIPVLESDRANEGWYKPLSGGLTSETIARAV